MGTQVEDEGVESRAQADGGENTQTQPVAAPEELPLYSGDVLPCVCVCAYVCVCVSICMCVYVSV